MFRQLTSCFVVVGLAAATACVTTPGSNSYAEVSGRLFRINSGPGGARVFQPCPGSMADTLLLVSAEGHGYRDLTRLDSLGVSNLPGGVHVRLHGRVAEQKPARSVHGTDKAFYVSKVVSANPAGQCS